MKKSITILLVTSIFTLLSALVLNACKKDVTAVPKPTVFVCDTTTISFINDVKPIFEQNCSTPGCHNSGTNQSGVTLETYSQISGSISYTIDLIKHTTGFIPMPPSPAEKLHDTIIAKIECWIEAGTPNN